MAKKEINQTIKLSGEKEYNRAIAETQRNLKTLRTAMAAETAELGKSATQQQKAEVRAKSLKKQIEEQEKAIATLTKALEEAKRDYGDNEDVVQKWEQKLNTARATLANMRNELDSVGEGTKRGIVSTKSFADSLEKIAETGEAVSGAIEGIFTGMVDTVGDAISAVWGQMITLAGRANGWEDLAGYWNTSAGTIQKWERSVESAHNSFADLENAVTRINLGDPQKIAEAVHVSGEGYTDRWEYAMAVMDRLAEMDFDQRLEAAGEVFGEKRATKVLDLLNDWGTIQANLPRFDAENGGIGLSEGLIGDMAELAVQADTLSQTWDGFIEKFAGEHLGTLALDLTGNAQRILDDLIQWIDSGDDADLEKLESDIEEFFDRIERAILGAADKLGEAGKKLEESNNGIVKAIGAALQGAAGALEWLSEEENIQKVIHGFELLGAFWLTGKGVQLAGTITSLAANLKLISGFGGLGSAGAAGGAGGSGILAALGKAVIPVSLAAITCGPILERLIRGESEEEKLAREQAEKINEVGGALQGAQDHTADAGKALIETLLTGKSPTLERKVSEARGAQEAENAGELPIVHVDGNGPSSPVKSARMDATAAQQAAAEAFWDVWRSGEYTDEEFDAALARMEAAFEGNEATLQRLDEWLDRIMEEMNSREGTEGFEAESWMDLPASWWKNPAGNSGGEGLTGADLQGFRGLPAGIVAAVRQGAASGVRGIQVKLDGRSVGELVAPYVSEQIAQDLEMD